MPHVLIAKLHQSKRKKKFSAKNYSDHQVLHVLKDPKDPKDLKDLKDPKVPIDFKDFKDKHALISRENLPVSAKMRNFAAK
ncbi:MAG: hypothetical protein II674_04325 [Prevotella sp.]|nr:hypothetical protein [Prevotella sp.]